MSFPVLLGWLAVIGACASLLQAAANRLSIPHTVLLAGLGIGLGILSALADRIGGDGPVAEAAQTLSSLEIGSQPIIYIFLPLLLFQTALTIDVRRMLDDVAPILLLAVVAVFICTFFVGFALAGVSDYSLITCLLLGSIIATTDPIAVVGVFRDVGAPRRLSILVEGESLFNDAAAIALFAVLAELLITQRQTGLSEGIWLFIRSFLGGGLVGLLSGLLCLLVLRPVRDLQLAEASITLALAYLSFIVAQHYLDVSGVVAVVVAALVVGSIGRTMVSLRTWKFLVKIWDQLGYWSSALIFILASMLVPEFLGTVGPWDLLYLLVLIVAATVARAVVVFGLLPALATIGLAQKVSGAYKAVILWGGLRGAVTLALALSITEHPWIPPDLKRFIAVLATGFVLFTLLVNAPTLRLVMRWFGLDRLSHLDAVARNRAIALAMSRVTDTIEKTAQDHHIGDEIRDDVSGIYRLRRHLADREEEEWQSPEEPQIVGLIALANREEELYRFHFAEGRVSRPAVVPLLAKAGRLRDNAKVRGRDGYLAAARDRLRFRVAFRWAHWLHRRLWLQHPLARVLSDRFEMLLVTRMVLEELLEFADDKLKTILDPSTGEWLSGVLRERLAVCEESLAAMRLQYPEYARALAERFLRLAALRTEDHEYRTLLSESLISQEVHNELRKRLLHERRALEVKPKLDLKLDTVDLIRRMPLFEPLSDQEVRELATILRPRLAYPGQRLMERGERGDFMLFISSGAVEVARDEQRFRLGRGDFVGELALITFRRRTASVTAIAYCRLLELPGREFRDFLRAHPAIRAHLRSVADERLKVGSAVVPA